MTAVELQVDRHTAPTSRRAALEADVLAGLSAEGKTLPPKWSYDARGSVLFDQIPRLLLDTLDQAGTLRRFVGDVEHHLPLLPAGGRRLFAFLGGTIGNLLPAERAVFLRALRSTMAAGDCLLLGTDLVKDPERLVPAYDDAAGVTAEFNHNVLRVLQRELGAEMDLSAFTHRAVWDADHAWIEMHLVSQCPQVLRVCGRVHPLSEGESIRTEISAKLTPAGVQAELHAAGLETLRRWTDSGGDYAVSLAVAA